jgi:hypothetical protein
MSKDPNKYPAGWNPKKVQRVIKHYQEQDEASAIAEAEAVYRRRKSAVVEVPVKFLPQLRRLIAGTR